MNISVCLNGETEYQAITIATTMYKKRHGGDASVRTKKVLRHLKNINQFLSTPPFKGDCYFRLDVEHLTLFLICLDFAWTERALPLERSEYEDLTERIDRKREVLIRTEDWL